MRKEKYNGLAQDKQIDNVLVARSSRLLLVDLIIIRHFSDLHSRRLSKVIYTKCDIVIIKHRQP